MNKRLSLLLTALVLALALTACGDGKKEPAGSGPQDSHTDQSDTGGPITGDAVTDPTDGQDRQETPGSDAIPGRDDNTVTAPDTNPGQSPAAMPDGPDNAAKNAARSAKDTVEADAAKLGTDLEQMLKNARVHDPTLLR